MYFPTDPLRRALRERLEVTKAIPTGDVIAHGALSSIVELKIPGSRERVAGKVFKIDPSDTQQLMNKVDEIIEKITAISCLSHSNVVGSKGVCFLPDRILPVLLMERMEHSLQSYFKKNFNILMEKKVEVLQDTASGLQYLHSLDPPFIHGHLTAENVLLDARLTAKIGGFDIGRLPQVPQYTEYTPPEAQGGGTPSHPSYDVFSFGHLCLVTLLHRELKELLPVQYSDNDGELRIRHEEERRAEFIEEVKKILPENQPLLNTIVGCLHNKSKSRPQTLKIWEKIKDTTLSIKEPVSSGADDLSEKKTTGIVLPINLLLISLLNISL